MAAGAGWPPEVWWGGCYQSRRPQMAASPAYQTDYFQASPWLLGCTKMPGRIWRAGRDSSGQTDSDCLLCNHVTALLVAPARTWRNVEKMKVWWGNTQQDKCNIEQKMRPQSCVFFLCEKCINKYWLDGCDWLNCCTFLIHLSPNACKTTDIPIILSCTLCFLLISKW